MMNDPLDFFGGSNSRNWQGLQSILLIMEATYSQYCAWLSDEAFLNKGVLHHIAIMQPFQETKCQPFSHNLIF